MRSTTTTAGSTVVEGVLVGIGLFPVKSVAGLSPTRVRVGPEGLQHDRGFALVGAEGEVLTARRVPQVRGLVLTGDPASPRVTAADGRDASAVLGFPVRLLAQDGGARQVAPVHVVSTAQRAAPDAGDSSRANLVVRLDDEEPGPDAFTGARLRVGEVELLLEQRPRHCAGLFARVLVPGTVHVGDPVRLSVGARGHG